MRVYVVIELVQGVLDEVRVFRSKESADKTELRWLKDYGITNDIEREGHAQNGTELIVRQSNVRP